MKPFRILLAGLFALGWSVRGQGVLSAGDSFAYQFSSMPFIWTVPSSFPGPFGYFQLDVSAAGWQPGTSLRYEMFETSTSETPIFSDTLDQPPVSGGAAGVPNAWQDLQGAIRITALSGSAILDGITVSAFLPSQSVPGYLDIYQASVSIPEPSTATLLLAGIGLVLGKRWRQLRHLGRD